MVRRLGPPRFGRGREQKAIENGPGREPDTCCARHTGGFRFLSWPACSSLHGVIGREAGTVSGCDHSDALRGAGFTWDPDHLERWLANANAFLPGSSMNDRQNDDAVRKEIIRYLLSLPVN